MGGSGVLAVPALTPSCVESRAVGEDRLSNTEAPLASSNTLDFCLEKLHRGAEHIEYVPFRLWNSL